MKGILKHWWTVPAVVMGLLLALIFRPELQRLVGGAPNARPHAEARPSAASSGVGPSVAASGVAASGAPSGAGTTAPTSASAPPAAIPVPPRTLAPPAPTVSEIDGKGKDVWRNILRGAADRGDAAIGADAFVALARIDAASFGDRSVFRDAVTAAHLAAAATEPLGDKVFAILDGRVLGSHGPDILYRLTSIHGGSRAAKRAAALLSRQSILDQGTRAMRIALLVRDAPCRARPPLFERASTEGDERTLYLLQAMRSDGCGQISCCMRNDPALARAMEAIRGRLKR